MSAMTAATVAAAARTTAGVLEAVAADAALCEATAETARRCVAALRAGGKILLCGNGGSAADAQHWAAELTARFMYDRPGLAAVALTVDTSALTAIGNDYGYDRVFARQVEALGRAGDVLFALSTSGRSRSILAALEAARDRGVTTVGFTGRSGGDMGPLCDLLLRVPSDVTANIQEGHEVLGHAICLMIEAVMFPMDNGESMSILPSLFRPFTETIESYYSKACADAGVRPAELPLVLEELSFDRRAYEAEFVAISSPRQVRITWNGLASLWAFAQATSRMSRAMFEAQCAAASLGLAPELKIEGTTKVAVDLFELSKRLTHHNLDRWVDWAPTPNPLAGDNSDVEGNQIFLGALGWIMRHELAHHILRHHEHRPFIPSDLKAQELEADDLATKWMKGDYVTDRDRPLGDRPSQTEIELERRALVMFVGMIWVAQFELGLRGENTTHPDAVTRLSKMAGYLGLSRDSFAAEILSYITKVLIDPAGHWPAGSVEASALDAAYDALIRLNRYISTQRG